MKCSQLATAEELLSENYNLSAEGRRIYYDIHSVSFTATISPAVGDENENKDVVEYESAGFILRDRTLFPLSTDIVSDTRSTQEIVNNVENTLSFIFSNPRFDSSNPSSSSAVGTMHFPHLIKSRFSLLWQVRLLKLMVTPEGRRIFLECLYHSVHTLLCCHPDGTLLSQFFQDKPDMVRDFLWFLRTGPGSVGYTPGLVPIYLRQLSCQCLNAIVGSRDSANVSVLGGRFSWLQHDLGVNRYVEETLFFAHLLACLSFYLFVRMLVRFLTFIVRLYVCLHTCLFIFCISIIFYSFFNFLLACSLT